METRAPQTLLATKLYVPQPRADLVPRAHLIRRLDEGLQAGHRLTLLSAPAGFGKTTLVSTWVRGCGLPVAWLSLDEGDNDTARFLAYLTAALKSVDVSLGEGPEAPSTLQPPSIETLLTSLINQVNSSSRRFILVFDDYHLITAQPVHDALTFLIERLPPQLHLVLASRADPPLPLARFRGRGYLTELRQADLRFTTEETTAFLNEVMDLELSAEDIEALASCTEGWIAGLQMAAVSMQGREDLQGFVQTFAGSNRYILDYLVEEVLQHQSEEVQSFLLQTAILDQMSGPLCDAVVGVEGRSGEADHSRNGSFSLAHGRVTSQGQEMLEYLERANLFVVPLDSRREWYRYHRLFSDLLRKRLQEVAPDLIPGLHHRASLWYEQHEDTAEAIHHALAAEDFERAAVLIERATEATLMRSEVTTFLSWVEALPAALVRARTELSIWYTWVLLLNGCPLKTIEARLHEEENAPDFSPAKALPLRLFIALFQGNLPQAAELSRQALEQLPEDALFLRSLVTWFSGAAESVYGDSEACQRSLEETARKGQEAGNLLVMVGAVSHRAEVQMRVGQLHEAEATYQRALASAKDRQGRALPIASEPLLGLGHLAWEWGDLEAAERHLRNGIALARQWMPLSALEGYLILAYVKQAQGDSDSACTVLQEAQELAARFDITDLDDFIVALYQAQQWIAQGDLESAARWARQRGLLEGDRVVALGEQDDPASEYMRRHEQLTFARLLLALGRPGDALSLLEPLAATLERDEQIETCIEAHILIALALAASGSPSQALAAMKYALSRAEPGGYIRPFVDEGMAIVPLLRQAATQGIAVGYVARLLEALEARLKTTVTIVTAPLEHPRQSSDKSDHVLLVEPLSEREIEVVRALAEGLSNQEIAEMLFITVGTVKKHLKNIYGKLGVHSRTHAVAHARESGLL